MRLLLTRPRPEAERTAKALQTRGHAVMFAPMLTIENLDSASIGKGPFCAVVMTSGNAARALAMHPERETVLSLRCFAVGRQTAEAARAVGFREVISADGDGGDLAKRVAQELPQQTAPILYLAGDDRARDMAADLAPAGLRLTIVVIYRAVAAQAFDPEIVAALRDGRVDGVLHYSRRSTGIFVACAQRAGLIEAAARLHHYCLSRKAAEPLSEIGAGHISVAIRPEEQAMLDLVG